MIKKIIEIISNIIEYLRNYQLIRAGENNIRKKILEEENETNRKISAIKDNVDNLSSNDVERLLDIKIDTK